ncbi:MAG: 50S ribosomal protein L28 [Thermaceae bacterium]|nr:50S ribosomal protein L28 [Thermaceae bacterium]
MSRICEISGKRPTVAMSVTYRGKAKREGGVGKKITGYSKHWQAPNLRKVTVHVGEHDITFKVAVSHAHKVYELVERSKGMKLAGLTAKQVKTRLLNLL